MISPLIGAKSVNSDGARQMKTQAEIEKLKAEVQAKIDKFRELSRSHRNAIREKHHYEHEYRKYVAQYNILIEVLK